MVFHGKSLCFAFLLDFPDPSLLPLCQSLFSLKRRLAHEEQSDARTSDVRDDQYAGYDQGEQAC
jgi:hypothetical protein